MEKLTKAQKTIRLIGKILVGFTAIVLFLIGVAYLVQPRSGGDHTSYTKVNTGDKHP